MLGVGVGALIFKAAIVPLIAAHPFQFPKGPVTLSPGNGEMYRDGVRFIVVANAAALIPARRSSKIKILDAIWG